ncbi:MAG TPA: hypothetical protein VM533_20860 [Fimbriiglobus sp.]|jgi:hypothetical protein|nr:hypothetical protein [Fimbriiglobus sp.]
MGRWRYLFLGLGLVGLPAGVYLLWRGPVTTVEIEFTGPPGMEGVCRYTVDGESGTTSCPIPCTVVIRGRDIQVARIGKAGRGDLGVRVALDGRVWQEETLETPGGWMSFDLPARHFWLRRGETPVSVAD